MDSDYKPSRRRALKTGIATIASAASIGSKTHAEVIPKMPGETRIVALMGDICHNPISQEIAVRQILGSNESWKILFLRRSGALTPELLSDTDLLITTRYEGNDPIGWIPEEIADRRIRGDRYMTDEQETAIIDNIKNRGMGWLALHCTIFTGRKAIEELLCIEPVMHQEIQPLISQDINPDHPITQGIGDFLINIDEQFDVIVQDHSKVTVLFNTLATHDKRVATTGWCLEQGKGRIVGLLPGHDRWPYQIPEYCEIIWRSAHWAMKKPIPPYGRNSRG